MADSEARQLNETITQMQAMLSELEDQPLTRSRYSIGEDFLTSYPGLHSALCVRAADLKRADIKTSIETLIDSHFEDEATLGLNAFH